ncbi:hypothetical protein U0070_001610, partial [Myodes glareolus]
DTTVDEIEDTTVDEKEDTTVNGIEDITVDGIKGTTVDGIEDITVDGIKGTTVDGIEDITVDGIKGTTVDRIMGSTVNGIKDTTVDGIKDTIIDGIKGSTVDGIKQNYYMLILSSLRNARRNDRKPPNGPVSSSRHLLAFPLKLNVCLILEHNRRRDNKAGEKMEERPQSPIWGSGFHQRRKGLDTAQISHFPSSPWPEHNSLETRHGKLTQKSSCQARRSYHSAHGKNGKRLKPPMKMLTLSSWRALDIFSMGRKEQVSNSEDHSAPSPILTNDETEAQERKVPATNHKLMVESALKPWPPKFQDNILSTNFFSEQSSWPVKPEPNKAVSPLASEPGIFVLPLHTFRKPSGFTADTLHWLHEVAEVDDEHKLSIRSQSQRSSY